MRSSERKLGLLSHLMVFVCGENEKNVYGKRQFEDFVRLVWSDEMRAELCVKMAMTWVMEDVTRGTIRCR